MRIVELDRLQNWLVMPSVVFVGVVKQVRDGVSDSIEQTSSISNLTDVEEIWTAIVFHRSPLETPVRVGWLLVEDVSLSHVAIRKA